MNSCDAQLLELALKKQALQFESERIRERLTVDAAFVPPLFGILDGVRAGWRWLRARPEIPVGIAVAMLVARPKSVWRWLRRGFIAWQSWRKARALIEKAVDTRLQQ